MKIWDRENTFLAILLLYCFVLSYFLPLSIQRIGYLPLLFIAFYSKRNPIWLALLFVLLDNPAYFFLGGPKEIVGRAPWYPLGPGMVIGFEEFLIWVIILKGFASRKTTILYKDETIVFGTVFFLAFFVSFLYSFGIEELIRFERQFSILILIIFIPKLLPNEQQWFSFLKLLYPIMFLTLFDQINIFITGVPFASLFSPQILIYEVADQVSKSSLEASRVISAAAINFSCFSSSLILLASGKSIFKWKYYAHFILAICFLQVFLSATRGWFIAYSVMIFIFLMSATNIRSAKKFIPSFIILFIVLNNLQNSTIIKVQINNAMKRMSTIDALIQGDTSAGGTLRRIDLRMPRLLSHIYESPYVGFGFSSEARKFADEHVGFLNPVIHFGFIGYFIISLAILKYIKKLYLVQKRSARNNPYRRMVGMSIAVFIGLCVIHFTSRQMFGLNQVSYINYLQVLVFALTNWTAVAALDYDKKLKG